MDESSQICLPNVQEQILIDKINAERTHIAELLKNPLKEFHALDVFRKYFAEDFTLSRFLAQPEVRDELQEGEPLPLMDQLHAQIDALQNELQLVVEQSKAKEEEHTRLRELMKEIRIVSNEEPVNEHNIDEIEKNIRKRFQLEKDRLKTVLSSILPIDIDTRDLIAKLVAAGINNPGEYVTIDEMEGTRERITMLLKTHLFELNPSGAQEIRMVDTS